MNKPKPCPFCGGKAELDFANKTFTYTSANGEPMDTGFFYTVKCCDAICGCRIGIYEDAEMAIEAWNRRTERSEDD